LIEDRQLVSQRGILQRDLFVAGEDENDESQNVENRFEQSFGGRTAGRECLKKVREGYSRGEDLSR
jgi:hypothetical protein